VASDTPTFGDELRPPGPADLRITEHTDDRGTQLTVHGELDVLTVPRFGSYMAEVVRNRRGDLVIDLRGVSFIDSTGLHILLNAQGRLTRQSRRLTVVCDPGPVRRVIELARLVETLGVVPGAT